MFLENNDVKVLQDIPQSSEQQQLPVSHCGVTSSSSQLVSPAVSDVTVAAGQLASRLSDVWDDALVEARFAEPPVDDPLHRNMLIFWVDSQEIKPSEFPPVSLISVIGEDGTLSGVDYPLKIGDYTFVVPEEQSPLSSCSGSCDSDGETNTMDGSSTQLRPAQSQSARGRRLLVATTDVTEGLYLFCHDFEQYARTMLDAEVTVVRNTLSRCRPETDQEHSLLYSVQELCERRWREEQALDIVDKLGSERLGNRGLVHFLVSHLRLLLNTQPELEKLRRTLPATLQAELLRIQTDFLASRIAARSLELQHPVPADAGDATGEGESGQLGDVNPTPYGPFGSPPQPRCWGW